MAFSGPETVVREACLSRSCHPVGRKQTNYATDIDWQAMRTTSLTALKAMQERNLSMRTTSLTVLKAMQERNLCSQGARYTIKGWLPTPVNFNVLLYLTFIIITLLKANCFKRVLNPNHCTSVCMLNPVFNSFPCTTVSYSDFPLFSKIWPIHPHKWFSTRSI